MTSKCEQRPQCNVTVHHAMLGAAPATGGVVVISHTLDLLQQHQQPLQQCAALFSHIQTFLLGKTLHACTLRTSCHPHSVLGQFWHRLCPCAQCLKAAHILQQHQHCLHPCQDQLVQQNLCCTAWHARLSDFAAAQESISGCKQDWSSVQSDFTKRFDTQMKQELSDQGSSITGTLTPTHNGTSHTALSTSITNHDACRSFCTPDTALDKQPLDADFIPPKLLVLLLSVLYSAAAGAVHATSHRLLHPSPRQLPQQHPG